MPREPKKREQAPQESSAPASESNEKKGKKGKKGRKSKPKQVPENNISNLGDHGAKVRVFGRGKRESAYVQYQWQGHKVVSPLGFFMVDSYGNRDQTLVAKALRIGLAALAALKKGDRPTLEDSQPDEASTIGASGTPAATPSAAPVTPSSNGASAVRTIEDGLEAFFADDGPTKNLKPVEVARLRQARDLAAKHLEGRSLASLTGADYETILTEAHKAIVEKAASDEAYARRCAPGAALGLRQAEIVLRRFHRIVSWLRNTKHWTEVPHLLLERTLMKKVTTAQARRRPKFTEDEARRIEEKLPFADPRLRLLVSIQSAQRAGQLLRCMRSDVDIRFGPHPGRVEEIKITVRGGLGKDPGFYYPSSEGMAALIFALEKGFLRELEAEYRRSGRDYPIFPGARRGSRLIPGRGKQHRLAPDEVLPVQRYGHFDRTTALDLFIELEALAGVPHVHRRGFHGFRRHAVDKLVDAGVPIAILMAAGGWKDVQMPMQVYRDKEQDVHARSARDWLDSSRTAARLRRPSDHGDDGGTPDGGQ